MSPTHAQPAPAQLLTARLRLQRWTLDDAPILRAALDRSDAHLRPWIPFMRYEPRSLAATREWLGEIRRDFEGGEILRWAVWTRAEEVLVGEAMLLARQGPGAVELGYWIHVDHCGHGYATESSRAMVELAAQRGADTLVVICDLDNAGSNAVARKLGAREVGREHEDWPEGLVELIRWELELLGARAGS